MKRGGTEGDTVKESESDEEEDSGKVGRNKYSMRYRKKLKEVKRNTEREILNCISMRKSQFTIYCTSVTTLKASHRLFCIECCKAIFSFTWSGL